MPPRIGLLPSRIADSERKIFSEPLDNFQEVTVAPYRFMVTLSRDGRLAVRTLFVRSIIGWGMAGDIGMADGLCLRSMVAGEDRSGLI